MNDSMGRAPIIFPMASDEGLPPKPTKFDASSLQYYRSGSVKSSSSITYYPKSGAFAFTKKGLKMVAGLGDRLRFARDVRTNKIYVVFDRNGEFYVKKSGKRMQFVCKQLAFENNFDDNMYYDFEMKFVEDYQNVFELTPINPRLSRDSVRNGVVDGKEDRFKESSIRNITTISPLPDNSADWKEDTYQTLPDRVRVKR